MIKQFDRNFSSRAALPGTAAPWRSGLAYPANPDLAHLLSRFESIGLAQMEKVAMLDRTETKYVLDVRQLGLALASLSEYYRVLDIDGIQQSGYQNLYFDTADFLLYLRHHAGARDRHKVRSRRYVDTNRSFLEVKFKTNKNRTVKHRVETGEFVSRFDAKASAFVHSHLALDTRSLEPKLWIDFSRITLVSKHQPERLTLDLNLWFGADEHAAALRDVVIAEVKQASENRNSVFIRQMQAMCLRPLEFSKYCIGVSMLYRNVKHNNFKPTLRAVMKLMGGS